MVKLQELLGIELPIIQAPMAGVQNSALAAAVCSAGGLGSLPCAMLGPEALRKELVALQSQTSRPFNVNFFCHVLPTPDPEREAAWRALLAPITRSSASARRISPPGRGEPHSATRWLTC